MNLDQIVDGLSQRVDADKLRALGTRLMALSKGDAALVVGWLANDWMDIYSRGVLDAPANSPVDSQADEDWSHITSSTHGA